MEEMLQLLRSEIAELENMVSKSKGCSFRSSEINELSSALSKAQGEFEIAGLNKANPYFKSKYADLASVVGAARPALTKYGLSVVQNIVANEEGASVLHTILLHASGQYIESRMRITPAKSDIQSISSYTTYIKRMAYASLVGVVTGDDSDDDGEAAVSQDRTAHVKAVGTVPVVTEPRTQEQGTATVSKDQIYELEYELEGFPKIAELMMSGYKIETIADLPKKYYIPAITRIRELKMEEKKK
jgi:hypothetical protein